MGWFIEILLAGWFFYLGASIGSFANVVAWRLPRGKSFASGRSQCPHCGIQLRMSDNIPVLGWLWLRGRCRNCGWKIPIRYFLVEVAYGTVFVLIYLADIRFGSGTSPWYEFLAQQNYAPLVRALNHITLMSLLGIVVLIRSEGFAIPRGLFYVGLIPPVLIGFSLTFYAVDSDPSKLPIGEVAFLSVLGMIIGVLAESALGAVITRARGAPFRSSNFDDYTGSLGLAWVGAYLGLSQLLACVFVAGIIAGATFLGQRWARVTIPASLFVFFGTLILMMVRLAPEEYGIPHSIWEFLWGLSSYPWLAILFVFSTSLLVLAWGRDLAKSSNSGDSER